MLAAIFHSAAIQHAADEWTEKEHTSQKESKAATTEMTHAVWGDCCPKEISMADFARLVPPARKDSLFKMDNPSMYSAPCHSKGTNECSKPCSDWWFEKLFCKQGQVCWRSGQRLRKNECRELAAQSPTEKAFRFPTPDDASKFPEVPLVASRPNVGIAASGGGSRAFASALGVFRALNQLKPKGSDKVMMDHVRYISGVSGGGWASTVFTYSQLPEADEQLTGSLNDWRPEKLTLKKLKERPAGSMAALPSGPKADMANIIKSMKKDQSADKKNFWNLYIEDAYFKSHKIGKNPFTWNSTTEKAIKERNPQLKDTTFLKPNGNKPYLILNTAMMGPAKSDLISRVHSDDDFNFVNFEIGSAYSGTPVSFSSTDLGWGGVEVRGYVESFALGAVTTNTDSNESTPIRETYFPENTLPWASGTGSTAYGIDTQEAMNSTTGAQSSANVLLPQLWYQPFGNQLASSDNRMAMMDAGNVENMGVMALLARRVEKLLVIVSTPSEIVRGTPTSGSSPCDFTALFGQLWEDVSTSECDLYRRNQVFHTTELDTVYTALRDEQEKGNLPITMQELTTVENKEYGVPEGHQVQVLFMFLGRAENFKKLVPQKTQSPPSLDTGGTCHISGCEPSRHATCVDGKCTCTDGTCAINGACVSVTDSTFLGRFWEEGTFPNYATGISLPAEQVNMVAALMQWGVENNKDMFDQFFETVLI